jgi:tetratricopeptide (TPR) repeat protein
MLLLEAMKPLQRTEPPGTTSAPDPPGGSLLCDQGNSSQVPGKETAAPGREPAFWLPIMLAAALIVLAAVAVYHNSFAGALIYDDLDAIIENQTIRQLWPVWSVLSPPRGGQTVTGRPLLNLSLAVNYAISGLNVWSYHVTNLLIHVAAALLLFGILRRTFLLPAMCERCGSAAVVLALAGALLWTVHPLQTESVTYIAQRAESLMGLFCLLTLYCVIRGAAGTVPIFARAKMGLSPSAGVKAGPKGTVPFFAEHDARQNKFVGGKKGDCPRGEKGDCPPWSWVWYAAAVLACLLGMACKEVIVTAPLIVLLYDRTFLAGSFVEALRRRWGLYLGLAATWGLLACLVLSTGLIGRQAELGSPGFWSYARTQPGVILHYLRLSVWPHPLCLDYAWPVANTLGEILPGVIVVGVLLAATVWGLITQKAWGFLGAWFFLILAPTSSILPLAELEFEHRMYLPLAAVAVLTVTGGYAVWDWLLALLVSQRGQSPFSPAMTSGKTGLSAAKKGTGPGAKKGTGPGLDPMLRWAAPAVVLAAVLVALGWATVARNENYHSAPAFWQDAVDKHPRSFYVHYALGNALASSDRTREAMEHFEESLRLKPDYFLAHNNLGRVLAFLGRTAEAIEHYRQALRARPDYAEAHYNLANALAHTGNAKEAIEHYQEALRLKPQYVEAHNNLANFFAGLGKSREAIEHYQEALRLRPDYAKAHNNLGSILALVGRTDEAIAHYTQALRLQPDYPDAHYNLANVLAGLRRTGEAIKHYHEAVRLKPDYAEAHLKLGSLFVAAGKSAEAIDHYQRALQLLPDSLEALNNLAWLLATHEPADGGDPAQAIRLAQRARELSGPENAQCLDTLAAAYATAGRFDDAVITAQQALRLAESSGEAPLAKRIRARLELYRAEQPYRERTRDQGPGIRG